MADPPFRRLLGYLRRRAYAGGPESDRALLAAYADRRDEAAFAELVRRHAGMVLGVARRVLGDAHAAEDVGQATFLVLARRAGSVRWRDSVANWLHGVAYRLALKARAESRRPPPPPTPRPPVAGPDATAAERELREVIDAELQRLPARYRAPLVLCYLEGRTRDEAAQQLGVSLAALRGHLERGREMLRARLLRRGYSLALGLTTVALTEEASAMSPAGRWAATTLAVAAGKANAPAAVERLAHGAFSAWAGRWVTAAVIVGLAAVTGGIVAGDLSMRRLKLALAVATATTAVPAPARAQVVTTYTIRDLGVFSPNNSGGINASGQVTGRILGPGGVGSHAFRTAPGGTLSDPNADLGTLGGRDSSGLSINASGQVTGQAQIASGEGHAFRTTATGRVSDPGTDLGTLGGASSVGFGINASGQVAGQAQIANGDYHVFRTTANGRVSDPGADLGNFGSSDGAGFGINASGQVTGYANTATTDVRAFRTTPTGKVSDPGTDLGTLGGTRSVGFAINDAGQVTGFATLSGNTARRAFRTTATGLISDPGTDLGTLPGGNDSRGLGINSAGVVVGWSTIADNTALHAFLFDSQMRDLNDLIPAGSGWVLNRAYAINDAGQITGAGTLNGQDHAFVLTPVPEPTSAGLGLLGGTLVGAWVVRRRRATVHSLPDALKPVEAARPDP